MDRNEFLLLCWKKIFQPLIYLLLLVFCANFFLNALKHSGIERLLMLLCLGIVTFYIIMYLFSHWLSTLKEKVLQKLSSKSKARLGLVGQVFGYVFLLSFASIIAYLFLKEDWTGVLIFSLAFIGQVRTVLLGKPAKG